MEVGAFVGWWVVVVGRGNFCLGGDGRDGDGRGGLLVVVGMEEILFSHLCLLH